MSPLVQKLSRYGTRVSLYPNAGMPDGNGRYNKTPESLVADLWPLLENHCLSIVGGCCGTTDTHIGMIAKAIEPIPGLRLSALSEERVTTLTSIANEVRTPHPKVRHKIPQKNNYSKPS